MSRIGDKLKGVIEHLKLIFGQKIEPKPPVADDPLDEATDYSDFQGVGDWPPKPQTVGQITYYPPWTPKATEPAKKVKKKYNADDYAWYNYVTVVDYADDKGKRDPSKLVLRASRKYKGGEERLKTVLADLKIKPIGPIKKGDNYYVAFVKTKEWDAASIEVEVDEKPASDTKFTYGPVEKWTSAGGVVIPAPDDFEHVYVCKPTNNFGPWAFPKGKVEKGETLAKAAAREVEEETGLKAKILPGGYLGAGAGGYSISHFFVMVQTGGSTAKHDPEMEEIRLVKWEDAIDLFAKSGNSRDVRIAMKAWEFVRRIQKRQEIDAAKGKKV